jgi:hypothetical protein
MTELETAWRFCEQNQERLFPVKAGNSLTIFGKDKLCG